jgi:hypothetical protein
MALEQSASGIGFRSAYKEANREKGSPKAAVAYLPSRGRKTLNRSCKEVDQGKALL